MDRKPITPPFLGFSDILNKHFNLNLSNYSKCSLLVPIGQGCMPMEIYKNHWVRQQPNSAPLRPKPRSRGSKKTRVQHKNLPGLLLMSQSHTSSCLRSFTYTTSFSKTDLPYPFSLVYSHWDLESLSQTSLPWGKIKSSSPVCVPSIAPTTIIVKWLILLTDG